MARKDLVVVEDEFRWMHGLKERVFLFLSVEV